MSFIAFMFDTYTLKDELYGEIAYDYIVGNLDKNNTDIIFRSGDFGRAIYKSLDVEPYIIRDEICNIEKDLNISDYIYAVCLDGISVENAKLINKKLSKVNGYLGMTSVSKETIVASRQFYKDLPINMHVINEKVFYEDYGDKEPGAYANIFKKYNFEISFIDGLFEYETNESKAFDLIGNKLELSYKLNMEVRIAGNLIWDSVERINKVSFFAKELGGSEPYIIENCYMSLYNAAQGIERLQKVLVKLLIRKNNVSVNDEQKCYDLLFHHNHMELDNYLKNDNKMKFNNTGRICSLLYEFYNKIRYVNYGTDEYSNKKFYDLIYDCFFDESMKGNTTINIRKKYVNALGQYAKELYNYIRNISSDLGIYTFELTDSPATYVFLDKDKLYDLYCKVNVCKMEFLNWLSDNKRITKFKPISFDKEATFRNISSIIKDDSFFCIDYVEEVYDELYKENKEKFMERYNAFMTLSDTLDL